MTRVAIVGVGGLGGPAARALCQAGVPLTLCDGDRIELHNLPRQTLFGEADVGRPKAEAAAARLQQLYGAADVRVIAERIEARHLARLVDHDVWIDATDRLASKLFFSDQAVARRQTLVHGGAVRLGGQVLGIVPGRGPCLRCLLGAEADAEGETCQAAGILGPVVALLGSEMARLTLRALAGEDIAGRYLSFDARAASLRAGVLSRRSGCEICERVACLPLEAVRSAELSPN